MRLKLLFLFAAMAITFSAEASICEVEQSRKTIVVDRHEIVDIQFRSSKNVAAPFECEFEALFTSPSGKEQRVLGFYNGDREWVIRFSASESGVWRYKTESDVAGLDRRSGSVEVSGRAYGGRRGSVMPNPAEPRQMVWEDGSPYVLLAFECDFITALDYHSDTAPHLNNFLDRVEESGFNHLVMNVYAHDVEWVKDENLKSKYEFGGDQTIFPFMGSNDAPDYSALNVEFFKRLDRTMEALNDRNIVSHLMIYVWNKGVAWPKVGSAEDDRYFDYVVKRYQSFTNLVWDISKEAIFYGKIDDSYVTRRIDRLRELDSYKRMVTVHDIGYCKRHNEKVDMVSHQNWRLMINADMSANYQRFTTKPILNVEHGGYEESDYEVFCGSYIDAEECLRRNYECLFAGVYSTYYWQGSSWNVIIYDWDSNDEVKYKPKMHYFKHLQAFFREYPFNEFHPDPDKNNSGYCMSNGKDIFLYYMPKESYRASIGSVMRKANKLTFQWFNTLTGEYSDVEECTLMNLHGNAPHAWHQEADAILIVKIVEPKSK